MSKSGLQAELTALKSNEAFLNEFLATEIYQLDTIKSAGEATPGAPEQAEPAAKANSPEIVASGEQTLEKTNVADTPAGPATNAPVAPPVVAKKNYEDKYVIWTAEVPSQAERLLIKKIIAAVNIPAARLVLETSLDTELSDWSTSAFVFAFGITTVDEKLHTTLPWKGTRLLKTYSLSELEAGIARKKELWAALKDTFSL